MEITYASIEPLILDTKIEGSKMICQFQPEGSDKVVESTVSIRRERTVKSQVTKTVRRNAINQFRRTAVGLLRSIFGGGVVTRVASQTITTTARNSDVGNGYTETEKQTAIVAAFKKVAKQFYYDSTKEVWTSPKNLSGFEKQLQSNPVKERYDKEILARLLAEMANADGEITQEEKDFLHSIIGSEFGSIDDLLEQELSPMECEEVEDGINGTIYMLAWTMALIDNDLDGEEIQKLNEYGQMFGLDDAQIQDFSLKAKFYVLENVIKAGGSKEDLFKAAEGIRATRREAEKCLIQYKKRNG
jgi:uncharacterized tellurite resistance protein B-like protein